MHLFTDSSWCLQTSGKYQSVWLRWPFTWGSSQKDTETRRLTLAEIHTLLGHFRDYFLSHRCWRQIQAHMRTRVPSKARFLNIGSGLRAWAFLWKSSSRAPARVSLCQVHRDGVGRVMSPLQPSVWFMTRAFSLRLSSRCVHTENLLSLWSYPFVSGRNFRCSLISLRQPINSSQEDFIQAEGALSRNIQFCCVESIFAIPNHTFQPQNTLWIIPADITSQLA